MPRLHVVAHRFSWLLAGDLQAQWIAGLKHRVIADRYPSGELPVSITPNARRVWRRKEDKHPPVSRLLRRIPWARTPSLLLPSTPPCFIHLAITRQSCALISRGFS